MSIIAISGKKGSGKDTVGKIIQILTSTGIRSINEVSDLIHQDVLFTTNTFPTSDWENKKFADKLKDIVCILLNCTREQLEDETFKEKQLGEEWWYKKANYIDADGLDAGSKLFAWKDTNYDELGYDYSLKPLKLTPRKLLQLLGTNCGRDIIHPNIWVNSLMNEYKTLGFEDKPNAVLEFPKWIITDMRFPNEFQAVKDREGVTIRVNRWIDRELTLDEATDLHIEGIAVYVIDDNNVESLITCADDFNISSRYVLEKIYDNHYSETALDDCNDFKYVIDNNGTLEELVEKIKQILIKEQII